MTEFGWSPEFDAALDAFAQARDEELALESESLDAIAANISEAASDLDDAMSEYAVDRVEEIFGGVQAQLEGLDVSRILALIAIHLPGYEREIEEWRAPERERPSDGPISMALLPDDLDDDAADEDIARAEENLLLERVHVIGRALTAGIVDASNLVGSLNPHTVAIETVGSFGGSCRALSMRLGGLYDLWWDALGAAANRAPDRLGALGDAIFACEQVLSRSRPRS